MSKRRISQKSVERCLLTEIAPFETPVPFSNWGSYNYYHSIRNKNHPQFLKTIFTGGTPSAPYKYRIKKNADSHRTLFVTHPKHSEAIVEFYRHYSVAILRACGRSRFSLRAPHHIAKFFTFGRLGGAYQKSIEDITEETPYASSYFAYSRFSHLHKFFDSDDFAELEKRFERMVYFDVTKFFASLYTHSISWAIRGKTRTKSLLLNRKNDGFDFTFDRLLQSINYNETAGIPIGPELTRIFAEIIMQRIDAKVMLRLQDGSNKPGSDYWCYRYIDDYYCFYNEERVRADFVKALREELEKFNLYLNDQKGKSSDRPFISSQSRLKIQISQYFNELRTRWPELRADRSQGEVNKLRSLARSSEMPFSSITSFFLSTVQRQIRGVSLTSTTRCYDTLYVLLDLAFYGFRMDIRVPCAFKMAVIVLLALEKAKTLSDPERNKVLDKIVYELRGAIENAIMQGNVSECLNVMVTSAEVSGVEVVTEGMLGSVIERCRIEHNDEYFQKKRLDYLEIVCLLHVIGSKAKFVAERAMVLDDVRWIMSKMDPRKYSECAHLLIDAVSCPYLTKQEKDELISLAMTSAGTKPNSTDVGAFRNYVGARSWYFSWTKQGELVKHLKKKELLLSY